MLVFYMAIYTTFKIWMIGGARRGSKRKEEMRGRKEREGGKERETETFQNDSPLTILTTLHRRRMITSEATSNASSSFLHVV